MQTNTRTETAHAMRTIVLWITLLLLSPYASCVVRAQGGTTEPSVVVGIKEYLAFPYSSITTSVSADVDFTKSATTCRDHGGVLTADQNDAAHQGISDKMRTVAAAGAQSAFTFLGADMMYSINLGIGGNPKCVRGTASPSLNCVYQWNLGGFADPDDENIGVSFYRGSMYNVSGSGPMNGYTPRWPPRFPAHGQAFILMNLPLTAGSTSTWYDSYGIASSNGNTPPSSFVVICEIQAPATLNTTETPTTTKPPSWMEQYWYVPVIASVGVVAVLFLLLIIFCCCCYRGEPDQIYPMVLREKCGLRLYYLDNASDPTEKESKFRRPNVENYCVDPCGQGIGLYPEWNQMNHFQEPSASVYLIKPGKDEIYGDQEIAPSSKGETTSFNKPIQKSLSLRKDPQHPSVEKEKPNVEKEDARDPPSSRRRSVRRSRLGKRISLSMSEVEVPLGEEIAEAKNDEQLQDASTTARRRSSVQLEDLDT